MRLDWLYRYDEVDVNGDDDIRWKKIQPRSYLQIFIAVGDVLSSKGAAFELRWFL